MCLLVMSKATPTKCPQQKCLIMSWMLRTTIKCYCGQGTSQETSTLDKELRAAKEDWEQRNKAVSRKSTALVIQHHTVIPENTHQVALHRLNRLYSGIYMYVHTKRPWVWKKAKKEIRRGSEGEKGSGKRHDYIIISKNQRNNFKNIFILWELLWPTIF